MTNQTALEYKKRICQAMNYISKNIDRDLSLEEIADSAAFSRFHFHRIFKAVVGETVASFTRRVRIEVAANRLLSNQLDDITTVAMESGFSSSQNFAKAFKQHFGMTPTQFRKSKIGNKYSKAENALTLKSLYDPDTLQLMKTTDKRRITMKAEIKTMENYTVAYVRKIGPYNKDTCAAAYSELAQWAGPKGFLETGSNLTLYWDNPEITAHDKCRLDACVSVPEGTVPEGQISLQTIKGGSYCVCHFEIDSDSFEQAWDEAFTWLVNSGYECREEPCYELYHNNAEEHPGGRWIVDICIPVKSGI